jgi:hypothetical protein
MDPQRYNELVDQVAHALKDNAEDAAILMAEAISQHGDDLWVAQCAVRDDVSARLGELPPMLVVQPLP